MVSRKINTDAIDENLLIASILARARLARQRHPFLTELPNPK